MHEYTHPIDDGYLRPVNSYETYLEGKDDEYVGVVGDDLAVTNNNEVCTGVDLDQNSRDNYVDFESPDYGEAETSGSFVSTRVLEY